MEPTVCIETKTVSEHKVKRGRPRKVDIQNQGHRTSEVTESTKVALPLSN
ncbi:MAG: hypothetical protein HY512_02410 [Candidatus Aenigmarchaeota archaeon]|nr:hypothetical protein [Candidatus Aenigmarchaeota archaeon]